MKTKISFLASILACIAFVVFYISCEKDTIEPQEPAVDESASVESPGTLKSAAELGDGVFEWDLNSISRVSGKTTQRIDAVKFNGKIYYFYKGVTTNYIYYSYSSSPSGPWTQLRVPGEETPKAPAVTVFNDKLYLVLRGNSEKIYWRYMDTNGNWSGQYSTGVHYTKQAPAVCASEDYWFIIYKGRTGSYENRMNVVKFNKSNQIIQTGWIPSNYIHSSSAPAAEYYNGKLYVCYVGLSNGLWYTYGTTSLGWSIGYKVSLDNPAKPFLPYTSDPNCGGFGNRMFYTFSTRNWNGTQCNQHIYSWTGNPKLNLALDFIQDYDTPYRMEFQTAFSPFISIGGNQVIAFYSIYHVGQDDYIYSIIGDDY